MFDAICGTSTGAIVATALTRMPLSPAEIIKEFYKISRLIFPQSNYFVQWFYYIISFVLNVARYDCKAFETYLIDKSLSWSSDNGDPKLGIVALGRDKRKTSGFEIFVFKSSEDNVKLWQAIRASTAAPTYMEPMTINTNLEFVDGGLRSNCPVNEGMQLLGDTSASCLISIGCGIADSEKGGFRLGGIGVGRYAVDIISDAQIKWDDFYDHSQTSDDLKRCCVRLSPKYSAELKVYKLDEADKLEAILETYVNWLCEREERNTIEYRKKILDASKLLFAKSFSILSVTVNGKLFKEAKKLAVTSSRIESVEVKVKFSANQRCSVVSTESWITLVSDDAEQGRNNIKLQILFSDNFGANHRLPLGAEGIINIQYDDVDIDGSPITLRFSER